MDLDEALTTTRAVRRRLDLQRPVSLSVLDECLTLSLQAPTAGGVERWRWLFVADEGARIELASLCREACLVCVQRRPCPGGDPRTCPCPGHTLVGGRAAILDEPSGGAVLRIGPPSDMELPTGPAILGSGLHAHYRAPQCRRGRGTSAVRPRWRDTGRTAPSGLHNRDRSQGCEAVAGRRGRVSGAMGIAVRGIEYLDRCRLGRRKLTATALGLFRDDKARRLRSG